MYNLLALCAWCFAFSRVLADPAASVASLLGAQLLQQLEMLHAVFGLTSSRLVPLMVQVWGRLLVLTLVFLNDKAYVLLLLLL